MMPCSLEDADVSEEPATLILKTKIEGYPKYRYLSIKLLGMASQMLVLAIRIALKHQTSHVEGLNWIHLAHDRDHGGLF
jgi:hypothetical protein